MTNQPPDRGTTTTRPNPIALESIERIAGWAGTVGVALTVLFNAAMIGGVTPTARLITGVLASVCLCCGLIVTWFRRGQFGLGIPGGVTLSAALIVALAAFGTITYEKDDATGNHSNIRQSATSPASRGLRTADQMRHDRDVSTALTNIRVADSTSENAPPNRFTAVKPIHSVGLFSIAVHRSRLNLPIYASALAIGIATMMCVTTSRRRRVCVTILLGGGILMATWGIARISFGITHPMPPLNDAFANLNLSPDEAVVRRATSFGSILYKNAAAAWFIPAVAFSFAMTHDHLRRARRQGRPSINAAVVAYAAATCLGLAVMLLARSMGAVLVTTIAIVVTLGVLHRHDLSMLQRRPSLPSLIATAVVFITLLMLSVGAMSNREISGHYTSGRWKNDTRLEQWPVAVRAAKAYLVTGSGLGTYRYVSLEHQTDIQSEWFKNAHQQYLEVLVELGLPGLLLAMVTLFGLARNFGSVTDPERDRTISRTPAVIGLLTLIAGLLHALFDFVITVPAVLTIYTVVFALCLKTLNAGEPRTRWNDRSAWAGIAITGTILIFSVHYLWLNERSSRTRDEAKLALHSDPLDSQSLVDPSDVDPLKRAQRLINHSISLCPLDPANHKLLASIHEARFVRSVRRNAVDIFGTEIPAAVAEPSRLQVVLDRVPEQTRNELIRNCRRHASITHAVNALRSIGNALHLQPSDPSALESAIRFAPLCELDIDHLGYRSHQLSRCNVWRMLDAGLTLKRAGGNDPATAHFRDHLRQRSHTLPRILEEYRSATTLRELCENVIPQTKPEMLTTVFEHCVTTTDSPGEPILSKRFVNVINALSNRRNTGPDTDVPMTAGLKASVLGQRHAVVARIALDGGHNDIAVEHFGIAVRRAPDDAGLRYEYADALMGVDRPDEATRQARLGAAIRPDDVRFEHLLAKARDLSRTTRREHRKRR